MTAATMESDKLTVVNTEVHGVLLTVRISETTEEIMTKKSDEGPESSERKLLFFVNAKRVSRDDFVALATSLKAMVGDVISGSLESIEKEVSVIAEELQPEAHDETFAHKLIAAVGER
jgi:hypothetical protein